jgi:hypothetical protein
MPLLNYTTTVPVHRTIGQVHALLVAAGARQIMTTYSGTGAPTGVSFGIATADGTRAFTLPVQIERVLGVMKRDKGTPQRLKTPEQAERVGWRILKDWLEAQLAILKTEMVTIDEVMLPYMRSTDGRTFYELYADGQLMQPAIGAGDA